MAGLVLLEAYFGGFFDAAANRHIRGVHQLYFEKKNKSLKKVEVLEQEELGVLSRQKTEVEHAPQRSLAEVVRVLILVLGQPDFSDHVIQARDEVNWLELIRFIGIESRQFHWVPRIP